MKVKRLIKIICVCLISVAVIISAAGCGGQKQSGTFIIELYPEYAPQTVDNFIKLVNEGFYDGLAFHRIVDDFMAQGGGYPPNKEISNENKKSADSIFGEFASNGYTENTLSHTGGVISMARMGHDFNSASSEFFICFNSIHPMQTASLDGDYAAFGKVTEGMEIIEDLQKVERKVGFDGAMSSPVEPIVIKKMILLEDGDGNPRVQVEIEY